MKKILAAIVMSIAATSANAEVNYNVNDTAHKKDMICIAALSLGRDMTHGFDNTKFKLFTSVQNDYILKYAYSKQLNNHINARKILLKGYGNNYVVQTINKCING